jgi:hypothetical protein
LNSYNTVPNYNINSINSVPNVNIPSINLNIPEFKVPEFKVPNVNFNNTNLNLKATEFKAIDTVSNYTINTNGIGYYPNESLQVGQKYVNDAIKNGQNTVAGYLKKGSHNPLTKVALESGAGIWTLQGACIDGCAAGTGGYFEWGVNANNLAARTDLVSAGGNTVNAFSQKLTGLKAGTTYYYRAVMQDKNGNKKYGKIMSFTVPYSKVVTTKTNSTNTIKNNTTTVTNKNTTNNSGAIVTENGGTKIIIMPDGRVITVDINGKTTVTNGTNTTVTNTNIGTCNCVDDLNNQNNTVAVNTNTQNTNATQIATSTSFWQSLKKMFGGSAESVANTSTSVNTQTNTTSSTSSGYSWYEWIMLFVFILVFVGAIRYLWSAFFKSNTGMH